MKSSFLQIINHHLFILRAVDEDVYVVADVDLIRGSIVRKDKIDLHRRRLNDLNS